jgi:hypothetical protein
MDADNNKRSYTPLTSPDRTQVTITNASLPMFSFTYTAGYGPNMAVTTLTDGSGATVPTNTYGDANDPYRPSAVKVGSPTSGKTTAFTWDRFGNLQTTTSPRGVTTEDYSGVMRRSIRSGA